MIFTRPAGAVMIFTGSRNAAASDNSMYCMIPDPFPSSAFGKGSATPDYTHNPMETRELQSKNGPYFFKVCSWFYVYIYT